MVGGVDLEWQGRHLWWHLSKNLGKVEVSHVNSYGKKIPKWEGSKSRVQRWQWVCLLKKLPESEPVSLKRYEWKGRPQKSNLEKEPDQVRCKSCEKRLWIWFNYVFKDLTIVLKILNSSTKNSLREEWNSIERPVWRQPKWDEKSWWLRLEEVGIFFSDSGYVFGVCPKCIHEKKKNHR